MAESTAKKKKAWLVTKANGKEVTVEAERQEEDNGVVRFFDGDEQVARFVGTQSIEPT